MVFTKYCWARERFYKLNKQTNTILCHLIEEKNKLLSNHTYTKLKIWRETGVRRIITSIYVKTCSQKSLTENPLTNNDLHANPCNKLQNTGLIKL